MPEFISKVQYKNCEDGEYYDEKSRSLEETLTLIESYPWAREQYADVEFTGPSVTIQNKKGEFFRLGIYYGGRFTLHFLDTKHHHYTRKNVTMETATNAVTNFFSGALSLKDFERHSLAFIRKYFETKSFEYRFSIWKALLLTFDWSVLFVLFAGFSGVAFLSKSDKAVSVITGIIALVFGVITFNILNKLFVMRGQYLRISRGNDVFMFGDTAESIEEYNKNDITKLITYDNVVGSRYRKRNTLLKLYEIHLSNGMFIKFSNVLISDTDLEAKFSNKWKFESEAIETPALEILNNL